MLIPFDNLFERFGLSCKGVLHIGANVGEERDMYLSLGMRKQIWIEANPAIFLILKQNLSHNPDALALNYCIGDEDKAAILHISNNGSQSSSVLELGTHKQEHPDVHYVAHVAVPMRRIDGLGLNLNDIDFLNIDVQGFELNVLRGMGDIVSQFKAIYLEVNKSEVYVGCAQIEDLDFYLASYGFQRVETQWARNKTWGDALWVQSATEN